MKGKIGMAAGIIAMVLLLAGTAICITEKQPKAKGSLWNSHIRTGVMVSDGSAPTDYFLEFFIPIWANDKSLFFFNPHERIDKDTNEENIGFGGRTLLADDKLILGLNVFYDRMKSQYDEYYNQAGVGFEALSKWIDFRGNYYKPFGTKEHFISGMEEYQFGSTSLLQYRGVEEALEGFDVEAGVLVPFISDFVETRLFGGYFQYNSDNWDNIDGWKARLELKPNKLITLMAETGHDSLRGEQRFYGGYLDLPFSFEELFRGRNPFVGFQDALAFGKGARSLTERMTDRIVRDRHITAPVHISRKPIKAPGVPEMIYVDADNPTEGDGSGTLSDPYKDIASVKDDPRWVEGAVVYIKSSDSTADTYTNVKIDLKNNSVLWGQGYRHPVYRLGGGPSPILDGVGNDYVIGLANNNEVMGLSILNSNHGIYYGPSITNYGASYTGIKGTNIHDNIIQYTAAPESGIHIENVFSGADVAGIPLVYTFSNNTISNQTGTGIYLKTEISDEDPVSDISITNRFINNTITDGLGRGIKVKNTIEAPSITDVAVLNYFSGNTIQNNGGDGIKVKNEIYAYNDTADDAGDIIASVTNATITNTFADNNIDGNGGSGVRAENLIGAEAYLLEDSIGGSVTAEVTGSTITNYFSGNTIDGNGGVSTGVHLYNFIGSVATVEDAEVAGNVESTTSDGGIYNTFANNSISGNAGGGVYILNHVQYLEPDPDDDDVVTAVYDSLVGGDVLATVTGMTIANAFEGNTIDDNYAAPEANVHIMNFMTAKAYIEDSSVEGSIESRVEDGVITNVFTENSISNNEGGNDDDDVAGVRIFNMAMAEGSANWYGGESAVGGDILNTVTGITMANTFTDNTISGNSGGYESSGIAINNFMMAVTADELDYVDIGGSVESYVGHGSITNTFTGNTISGNEGMAVLLSNKIEAGADVEEDAAVSGGVSSTVEYMQIANVLGNNVITGNYGEDAEHTVHIMNDVLASSDVEGYPYYITEFLPLPVGGSLVSYVGNISIANTLTDNIIGVDPDDDESEGNEGGGVFIFNKVQSEHTTQLADIQGDILSTVTAVDIRNTIDDNVIDGNFGGASDEPSGLFVQSFIMATTGDEINGTIVGGDVASSVTDSSIITTVANNSISGNEGQGAVIHSMVEASADVENGYYYDNSWNYYGVDSEVGGSVTSRLEGIQVANTLTGNTIDDNYNGSEAAVHIKTTLVANPDIYDSVSGGGLASFIGDSSVVNTFTNNSISGNEGGGVFVFNQAISELTADDSEVGGDVLSTVEALSIANTFNTNVIDGNSGGEDEPAGVFVQNFVMATTGDEISGTDVDGKVASSISDVGITTAFTGNSVSGNEGQGIVIHGMVEASVDVESSSSVVGDIGSSVENILVSNSLTGNTIDDNYNGSEAAVHIKTTLIASSDIYNSEGGGGLSSTVSNGTITNTLTNNTIGMVDPEDEEDAGNEGGGVFVFNQVQSEITARYSEITEDILSTIGAVSIANTFNTNVIDGNSGGEDEPAGAFVQNFVMATTGDEIYSTDVGGRVESSISNVGITTAFTNNSVSGNEGQGIVIHGMVEASVDVESSSSVVGDIGSSVENILVANTLSDNVIDDNYGAWEAAVHIKTTLIASSDIYSSEGGGGLLSTVSNGTITNTLTDNSISGNEGGGVFVFNQVQSEITARYSEITEDILSTIGAVSIANTFDTNVIDGGDNYTWPSYYYDEPAGAFVQNFVMATTGDEINSTDVGGRVESSISDVGITTAFTGNSVSGNEGQGIVIHNLVEASADVENDSYVVGSIAAMVEGIQIVNSLTDNVVDDNYGNEAAVHIMNTMLSSADIESSTAEGSLVSSVSDGSIVNTLTGNSVSDNEGGGIFVFNQAMSELSAYNSDVGTDVLQSGDVLSTITYVTIDNTFDTNTVNGNFGAEDENAGIFVQNFMMATTGDQIYYFTDVGGSVKSTVSYVSIDTTLTNNEIIGNEGDGLVIHNLIEASADVEYNSSAEGIISTVESASVTNTLDGNIIDNTYGGESTGVHIMNFITASADIEGGSSIEEDIVSYIGNSSISNTLANNTIGLLEEDEDGYGGNEGGGVFLFNQVMSQVTGNGWGWEGNEIGSDMVATVASSSITNTFDANHIEGNFGMVEDEIGGGIDIKNFMMADAELYTTYVRGDVELIVGSSNINTTLSNNTITGNEGEGVFIHNFVQASLDEESSWNVDGDIIAAVNYVDVATTFDTNDITGNGGTGVRIMNFMRAVDAAEGYVLNSSIGNYFWNNNVIENAGTGIGVKNDVKASGEYSVIEAFTLTNEFIGNTVSDNTGTGIGVENGLEAFLIDETSVEDIYTGNIVTGNISEASGIDDITEISADGDSSVTSVFMQGNQVIDNAGYGVYLYFSGSGGSYSADLGTTEPEEGDSLGGNAFYGNTGNDLYNDTGTPINAQGNWWGQSEGPEDGQIGGPGLVDPSDWLTADPFAPII